MATPNDVIKANEKTKKSPADAARIFRRATIQLEPPLCVVSNWIIRVYIILVWSTISGSSNLDICFYHCLILTLIFHLKVLINFFIFIIIISISIRIITIISICIRITTITIISISIRIITIIIVVVVLLLLIIYTINLPMVRPWFCRVIYYFDTPALGRRYQFFGRVKFLTLLPGR